jgi:hypothetical protein
VFFWQFGAAELQHVLTLRRSGFEAADAGLLPPWLLLPAAESDLLKIERLSLLVAVELACETAFELFARPGRLGRPAAVAASPAVLRLLQNCLLNEMSVRTST